MSARASTSSAAAGAAPGGAASIPTSDSAAPRTSSNFVRALEGTLTRSISLAPYTSSVTPYPSTATRYSSNAPALDKRSSVGTEEEQDPQFLYLLPRLVVLFLAGLLNAASVAIALVVGIEVLGTEGTYDRAAASLRHQFPGFHLSFVDILASTCALAAVQFLGLLVAVAIAAFIFAHFPRQESRTWFRARTGIFVTLAVLQLAAVVLQTVYVASHTVKATGGVSQHVADGLLRNRGIFPSYHRVPLILAFTAISWVSWLIWMFCSLLVIRASTLALIPIQGDVEKATEEKTPGTFLGFCFGTSDKSRRRMSMDAKRKEVNVMRTLEALGVVDASQRQRSRKPKGFVSRLFTAGNASQHATKGSSESRGTVEILSAVSPVEPPTLREITRRAMGPGSVAAESLRQKSFERSSNQSHQQSESSNDDLAITPATTPTSVPAIPAAASIAPVAARRGLEPMVLPPLQTEVQFQPSGSKRSARSPYTPGLPADYDPRSPGYESYGSNEEIELPYSSYNGEVQYLPDGRRSSERAPGQLSTIEEREPTPPNVSEPVPQAMVEVAPLGSLGHSRGRSIEAWRRALQSLEATEAQLSSSDSQSDAGVSPPAPAPAPIMESVEPAPSPFSPSPLALTTSTPPLPSPFSQPPLALATSTPPLPSPFRHSPLPESTSPPPSPFHQSPLPELTPPPPSPFHQSPLPALPAGTPPPPSPFRQSALPDIQGPLTLEPLLIPEARSSLESLRAHTPSILTSVPEEPEPEERDLQRRDTSSSSNKTLSHPGSIEVLRTPSDGAQLSQLPFGRNGLSNGLSQGPLQTITDN